MDDRLTAYVLRRLHSQFCTPPGISRDEAREVRERGLAVFNEWPSGHWSITEAGWELVRASQPEGEN